MNDSARAALRNARHHPTPGALEEASRRPREFPVGYVYTPPGATPSTPSREAALAALSKLAHGVTPERLLERVAAHEQAEQLRGLLLEVGAHALTDGSGSAGSASLPGSSAPGAYSRAADPGPSHSGSRR